MSIKKIRSAKTTEMALLRELFCEYQNFLGFELCFQNFEDELQELPGCYSEPAGCLLLAELDGSVVGCIALRPLKAGCCEMKRLYVRPEGRGHGLGRALCQALIEEAVQKGYRSMKLDTVSKLQTAISLYRELGFVECAKYCENPHEDVVYMELNLVPEKK